MPDYNISNFSDVEALKDQADASPRLRAMKKLHESLESELHTMINVLKRGSYVAPHCHRLIDADGKEIKKGESFIALSGEGKLIIFSDDGKVTGVLPLRAKDQSMVWLDSQTWHTVVAISDHLAVFENKTGPYKDGYDKVFHPLFPEESGDYQAILAEWEKI